MSITSIKRHNHRVHVCDKSRKQELLQHLITLYAGKSILVISSANTATTQIEEKNLTLSNDAELAKTGEREWDLLISFDLPKDPQAYLTRLEHAKEMALIMIDANEQTLLYPIETVVGKNLPREIIPGFEPASPAAKRKSEKPPFSRPTASQQREVDAKKEQKEKQQAKKESYKKEARPQDLKDKDKGKKTKSSFGKKEWNKTPKANKSPDKKPWEKSSAANDYRSKKETTHTSNKPQRAPRIIKMPSEHKSKES